MKRKVRVAAVQASPVFPVSKAATADKICALIDEAASNGAELIVFPETFLPAYPNFSVNLDFPNQWRDNLALLQEESVTLDSPELARIRARVRRAGVTVCLGINEAVHGYDGVLYNSLVFIGPDGEIFGHHRKLLPSNRERCFWCRGDGTTLRVYETPVGRLGGLICYEHLQPLFKYALIAQGEQIHCASWPGWPDFKNGRSNRHVIDAANRAYALEGQCFVVAASLYVPEEVGAKYGFPGANWTFFGGSGIIAPDGRYLAGPVYDQETILYADLDMREIVLRKVAIDTTGRDHRWDIIRLDYRPFPYSPFAHPGQPGDLWGARAAAAPGGTMAAGLDGHGRAAERVKTAEESVET